MAVGSFSTSNYIEESTVNTITAAMDGASATTVCAKVLFTSLTVTATRTRQFNVGGTSGSLVLCGTLGNGTNMFFNIFGRPRAGNTSIDVTGTTALSTNTWYSVAWVYNWAANTYQFYLNGALEISGSAAWTDTSFLQAGANTQKTRIGLNAAAIAEAHNGSLAEIAVYNSAWTLDDAKGFQAGFTPIHIQPDGIVHYWKLLKAALVNQDLVGQTPVTTVGTLTSPDHPRVIGI